MYDLSKRLKPLTEEEKSLVRNYFSTGDTWGVWKGRLWYMYGRMRHHWEVIPEAEVTIERANLLKQDAYKKYKEREIATWLRNYFNEHQETGVYECLRVNEWEDWRSLVIWIIDFVNSKMVKRNVIEIYESLNPSYFSECMMKYAPNNALSSDKPF